jgi:DNA-binding beta-propeller fold protein YncE
MLALSADGSQAYVTNFWHGTVSVLDPQARRSRDINEIVKIDGLGLC